MFDKEKLLHAVYISVIVVMFIVVLTLSVVLWRMRRRLGKFHLNKTRVQESARARPNSMPFTFLAAIKATSIVASV